MGADTSDELLCILFTDLVGWTELGDRAGDEAAHLLRRDHFAAVRTQLDAHRGHEVKTAGDSVLATFRSAVDAVRCALAIQADAAATALQVRVGVHAGEPIADEGDVFGTSVNTASRLCAAATAGEVLVSDLIRSLVGRRGGFRFDDRGRLSLKGLTDAVHAFCVATGDAAGAASTPLPPRPTSASRPLENAERSLLCPVVVGRERELAVLTEALGGLPGQGGLAVLAGEAGVGKTRLTRELAAQARAQGTVVLSGRAVPGATPVPYRPLTEAFVGAFRSSRPTDLPELAGFSGQLGRLVPEWRGDTPGGADESPILLGEAVVRLLRVVAGDAGCLLVLEDLHWADAETLAVVEYLADALRESALCLCTSRVEGAAVEPLARLRRNADVTVLGLSRLERPAIEQVVAACLSLDIPPADVVDAVATNSEGNPFLIEELLAGLVASDALRFEDGRWLTTGRLSPSVPFDFAESMRQRLLSFDGAGRRVLRAAALLGRRFDWELLPALADADGRAVIDALRVAVDEQLLEVDGEVFRFRHALTREAVLSELLPPERRDLATRALPAVEGAHPGLPGEWCELAADLAEEAGDVEAAAKHLVESARRGLAAGALTSVEATARRAHVLASATVVADDADDVLVQILALAGKPEDAASVGEALLARLEPPGTFPERTANVLLVLARAAVAAGDTTRAQELVDRARSLIGGVDDAFAARFEALAAHVALDQARLDDARALATTAIDLAQRTEQPAVECEALEVLGRVDRYRPDRADLAWFERSAALAERHGLTTWQVRARHEIALVTAYTGGDVQPLHDARQLAERSGALVSVAVMDLALAEIGLGGFDAPMCIESALRCVDASSRYGLATLPVANLWLAGGYALADDVESMEAAAERALAPDPEDPRILGDLYGRVRATSAMVRDDRDQMRRDLDTMMTYVRVAPITTSIFPWRIFWALLHAIEDDDLGAAAREEMDRAARTFFWPIFSVATDTATAIALGREGRVVEAAALFEEAASRRSYRFDEGAVRYFELLACEAAIRDGWGEPVPRLRAAEAFFAARGYDRIVRRCHTLLAAAGAPVPRRGRGDSVVPEKLRALGITSRELDVLNLVGEGLSNREIADRLVLSPKTVERHLSSLFSRTGSRNRTELAELRQQLIG